jgi:MFS family permease
VSGLWTSTFALGSFVGPSVAGILYDQVGFRYSTLFVIITNALLVSTFSFKNKFKLLLFFLSM